MKHIHDVITGKAMMTYSLLLSKPGLSPEMLMEANAHYNNITTDKRCQQATPLLAAVFSRCLALVKCLVEEGTDVEEGKFEGIRPLSVALANGSFDIASFLIASGADVKSADKLNEGRCPMFYAIHTDSPVAIVKELIAAGADKDSIIEQSSNMRPIMKAVLDSNIPVIRFLLEEFVEINYPVKGELLCPLIFAIRENKFEIVKLLVDHGADIEGRAYDEGHFAPLICAIVVYKDDRICLRLLAKSGADVNRLFPMHGHLLMMLITKNEKFLTALQFATLLGNHDAVKILLYHGANVNALTPRNKSTALHLACLASKAVEALQKQNTHAQIINTLVSHGADLLMKDVLYHSPVKCCFISNNFIALEELVKLGADVNEIHGDEGSVLTYAIMQSNAQLVELCLEHGGDSNIIFKGKFVYQMAFDQNNIDLANVIFKYHPIDDFKKTKRCAAIYENQLMFLDGIQNNDDNAVQRSLQNGAEPKAFRKEMRHPIFLPVHHQNLAILKDLMNRGVYPNVQNQHKKTPLHLACQKGFYDGCLELLSHGACYNSKSSLGQTPLAIAKSSPNRNKEIVFLLETIRRMFRLARKGLLTLENIETLPEEVLLSNINCVNRNGNTLMQETIISGSFQVAKSIINRRMGLSISFAR